MLNHILLELYCLQDIDTNANADRPQYCQSADNCPSYACLMNGCPYLDFTTCENTLCYINEASEMEEGISLGAEMVKDGAFDASLKRWRDISLKKILEAYKQYMET